MKIGIITFTTKGRIWNHFSNRNIYLSMNREFKVGDVVRLKTGGPDMIIESIGPHGHGFTNGAWCVWGWETRRKREFFEFVTLCHVDTKTAGAKAE